MSLLLSLSLSLAQAEGNCNTNAYSKTIETNTGDAAAVAFSALAQCDPNKARHFARTTVSTFRPNKEGYEATVWAMRLGEKALAMNWMKRLSPSDQKEFLRMLGNSCKNDKVVQEFFLDKAANDADKFWGNSYYEHLLTCRVISIQEVLSKQIDVGLEQESSQYFSVMSVYARNLEYNSLPKLGELLAASEDVEAQTKIIAAIFEAVDETTKNYAEDKNIIRNVNKDSVKIIVDSSHKLEQETLSQVRVFLTAIGAEAEADSMAGYYYKDQKQDDETLLWGVVVVENATCRKGKLKQSIHSGSIIEQGNTWADQLEERVSEVASFAWDIDLAKSCKGTSEIVYFVPPAPFSNIDEYDVWAEKIKLEQMNPEVKKPIFFDHDPISL